MIFLKKQQKPVTGNPKLRPNGENVQKNNLKLNIMEGLFVPIAFFLMVFAILYVYYTTRSRERLALVEKGADASIFKVESSKYVLLKWGVFLIGLAVGVITGYALSTLINEVVAFFTTVLLFGGLGLIVAYWVTSKLESK